MTGKLEKTERLGTCTWGRGGSVTPPATPSPPSRSHQSHSLVLGPGRQRQDLRGRVKGQGGDRGQQVHHRLQRLRIGRAQALLLRVDVDHARPRAEGNTGTFTPSSTVQPIRGQRGVSYPQARCRPLAAAAIDVPLTQPSSGNVLTQRRLRVSQTYTSPSSAHTHTHDQTTGSSSGIAVKTHLSGQKLCCHHEKRPQR